MHGYAVTDRQSNHGVSCLLYRILDGFHEFALILQVPNSKLLHCFGVDCGSSGILIGKLIG